MELVIKGLIQYSYCNSRHQLKTLNLHMAREKDTTHNFQMGRKTNYSLPAFHTYVEI